MKVLLFTPGLDSFLSLLRFKELNDVPDVLLYFTTGASYQNNEIYLLNKWYGSNQVRIVNAFDFSKYEFKNGSAAIPNRNAFLVLFANLLYPDAEVIYLSRTLDDEKKDMSESFFMNMTSLLNCMSYSLVKHKVGSILSDRSKSDWIEYFAEKNRKTKLNMLTKTYSCYNSDLQENCTNYYFRRDSKFIESKKVVSFYGCLSCKACFRKLVALTAANIYVKGLFPTSLIDEYRYKFQNSDSRRAAQFKAYEKFFYTV